jgi:hypothetical protein
MERLLTRKVLFSSAPSRSLEKGDVENAKRRREPITKEETE